MKNRMKTSGISKLNNLLTISLGKNGLLSVCDMKRIKGGDGEDNGGGNIIIPFGVKR